MNIAIIGYGKMGHIVERIALERGHEIVAVVDADDEEVFDSDAFARADVAIEFTTPDAAVTNYRKAWRVGVPVVSGTTGWTAQLPALKEEIAAGGHTLFWSSNFSLGVNIFFELNRRLADIMNAYPAYDVCMKEVHHTAKKDAPSGTAITLAEEILERVERKHEWRLDTPEADFSSDKFVLPIEAVREGSIPGTHVIEYRSSVDAITIRHEAFSRDGFALGAVMAAEFVAGKKGFFTMHDMMSF